MPRLPHISEQAAVLFWALLKNAGEWQHGYGLMSVTGLQSGTLYPLLFRLADEGFLESRWEVNDDNAKPRREYRLTASGQTLARERLSRFAAKEESRSKEAPA